VDDEVLAGLAPLIGVVRACVDERLLDAISVDRNCGLVGVLLDDREQVAEQPPLNRTQLRPLYRRLAVRVLDPIDRRASGGDQRRSATGVGLLAGFLLLLSNR